MNMNDENNTTVKMNTPIGEISLDMLEYHEANKLAKNHVSPQEFSIARKTVREFLGTEDKVDFRYWESKLGSLIKMHMDDHFADATLLKEFEFDGALQTDAIYSSIFLGEKGYARFMASGWRFYVRTTESGEEKFAVNSSVDSDGDQRLTVITSTEGRGLEIIEELMDSFYESGPLNGGFFDLQYNFLKRHQKTNELMAWNPHIKTALERDVLNFIKVMPILKENGLPNSRGIILSGPPGTGKTMIAKSMASETEATTILISAEMIQQRNDIKSAFRLARKLAPTLIIIEDIDTAGTVSRRFADHPILGEYLQAMDGIEANEGVVVLATTNHTENIDPAISDRPGRFDRIIEVPLPDAEQRINILANLLAKMPTDNLTFGLGTKDFFGNETISEIGRDAKHLSGAWIREIVHTAFIFATYDGRDAISAKDLRAALKDVKERRGLAYKSTPKLEHNYREGDSEVNSLFI